MRRHDPDALTAREREVLALIRLGFTNEEIARRLGISLDVAKYHVSQILSKLGVATREEAAALALAERRRWWARWPLWAKIAGAATLAAAVAGLALLVWAAARTGGPGDDPAPITGLTLDEAFRRVEQAMVRPGHVLHTTIEASGPPDGDGEQQDPDELSPVFTTELWLDAPNETARSHFRLDPSRDSYDIAEEATSIVIGDYVYVPDDLDEVLRHPLKTTGQSPCAGNDSALLSLLLSCSAGLPFGEPLDEAFGSRLEAAQYNGKSAVALVFEKSEQIPVAQGGPPQPPPLSPTPTQAVPPERFEVRTVARIYLDRETFLPIAREGEYGREDEGRARFVLSYRHEFVRADELPAAFLDPRSIGYGAEGAGPLLDGIEREIPVYWLGEEIDAPGHVCSTPGGECDLVLIQVLQQDPGSAQLVYETPNGVGALTLYLFSPEDFERFRQTDLGGVLYDAPCVQRSERDLDGVARAVVFRTHRPPFSGDATGPIAGPLPCDIPQVTAPPPPVGAPGGVGVRTPAANPAFPVATDLLLPTLANGCSATAPDHFPAHVFFEDAVIGVNIPLYPDHPIPFPVFDTSAGIEFVIENLRRRPPTP